MIWLDGCHFTIGEFWENLRTLKRYDVIQDCRRNILSDCQTFLAGEEYPVRDFKCMSEYFPDDDDCYSKQFEYDAFVIHNQDDPEERRFVEDLIEELEGRRGLRLYVPGRDNRLDASENIIHADEIEESCRRVIIVLSRSFFQTRLSVFQERFAQELSTAERRARMIAIIRERGAVVPVTLNECNTLDYNDMNEINWALLASSINEPITQDTYRRFIFNRNGRGLSFPFPAGGNENTVLTLRNSQPPPGPNRSPDPVSTEHTRTQWPDGESENTTPKTVHSDHTTPTFILSPPSSISTSSVPFAPEFRPDIQRFQKKRHITKSVHQDSDINVPATITQEDETKPKHVMPDKHIDSMSTVPLEYQNQLTAGMQTEQNTRDTLLSQSPISTGPDEQTTSQKPPLLADPSMTLYEQLISEPSSSDRQTGTSNLPSVKPNEHSENNN